jgi:hypothetical protein
MLAEEIRDIKSGRSELRTFGITLGIAFGLLSGLIYWRGKVSPLPFFIISALFFFFGLVLPGLLKPIQKAWMTLSVILGWVMTRVILIVAFYLMVTPIGLLARLFGKDFLSRKYDRDATTYWISKKDTPFDKKNYENQF